MSLASFALGFSPELCGACWPCVRERLARPLRSRLPVPTESYEHFLANSLSEMAARLSRRFPGRPTDRGQSQAWVDRQFTCASWEESCTADWVSASGSEPSHMVSHQTNYPQFYGCAFLSRDDRRQFPAMTAVNFLLPNDTRYWGLRRAGRGQRAAQEAQGERRDAIPPPQETRGRGPDRNRPPGEIRQSPSQLRRVAHVSRSLGENLTPFRLKNCGPQVTVDLPNQERHSA